MNNDEELAVAFSLTSQMVSFFEGCNLCPYRCPAGVWSIGFGSTLGKDGRPVGPKTPPITTQDAHTLMVERIKYFYTLLKKKVNVTLSSNQWAAILSLAYNIGCDAFIGSTLLRMINNNELCKAANEFLRWDKVHIPGQGYVVMAGLQKRRQSEKSVFLGYPFEP